MSNKRALLDVFEMYTSPSGMTSSKFIKIMKDSNLLDSSLKQTDADLIFTKVKSKGQRNISYEEFKRAVGMIASRKNVSTTDLVDYMHMTTSDGPSFAGTTVPVETRFYDDRDTYTGVHKAGGPTVVDKDKPQLHNLLDRSSADVRGVKQTMKEAHGRSSVAHQYQHSQSRSFGEDRTGSGPEELPRPPPARAAPTHPGGDHRASGEAAALLENLESRMRRTSLTGGTLGEGAPEKRGVSTRASITSHLQSRVTPPPPPPSHPSQLQHHQHPYPASRPGSHLGHAPHTSHDNQYGTHPSQHYQQQQRHYEERQEHSTESRPQRSAPPRPPAAPPGGRDPEKRLFEVYRTFCSNHADTLEMDSARFVKFCRDSGLLGSQLNTTAADLIFQKAKKSGNYGKRITFEDFRMVAIPEIAKKLSCSVEDVIGQSLYCEGPSLTNTTAAQEVRFHDDISTYTGVHHNGQTPSFTPANSTIALENLLDRSAADNRGVKLSSAAAAARAAGAQKKGGEVTYAGEANKKGGIYDRLSNTKSFTGVYAERFNNPAYKGQAEFRGHTNTGSDEPVHDIRQIVTRR